MKKVLTFIVAASLAFAVSAATDNDADKCSQVAGKEKKEKCEKKCADNKAYCEKEKACCKKGDSCKKQKIELKCSKLDRKAPAAKSCCEKKEAKECKEQSKGSCPKK